MLSAVIWTITPSENQQQDRTDGNNGQPGKGADETWYLASSTTPQDVVENFALLSKADRYQQILFFELNSY